VQETYFRIGTEVAWVVAAFGVLAQFVPNVVLWMKGRGFRIYPAQIAFTLMLLAWTVLGLPTEWMFAAILLVFALAVLFRRSDPDRPFPNRRMALAVIVVALLTGGATGWMSWQRITLTETTARWDGNFEGSGEVPRQGLRVHATGGTKRWWETRPWYSWTSFTADDEIGPGPMGSSVYIGPRGLMRGDDVGRRIADWSGRRPEYRALLR